jgi:hypothetical protein
MGFSTISYEALEHDLSGALQWLRSSGIRYEAGRFGHYKRSLKELLNSDRTPQPARSHVVTALYEIHDLIHIHQYLRGQSHHSLFARLKKFTTGPNTYTDERKSSNAARNFGFELVVLAWLAAARIQLNLDVDADAAATIDNRTVIFECKRPQSRKSLESNFKEACSKLRERYQTAPRVGYRGVVALDLTKLLNEDFRTYQFRSAEHVMDQLSQLCWDFMYGHDYLWQSVQEKNTIAVWARLCGMVVLTDDRKLTRFEVFPLRARDNIPHRNEITCNALGKAIAALNDLTQDGPAGERAQAS